MPDNISTLPRLIQKEIEHIVAIIREVADPEMIFLFGNYAGAHFEALPYASDYDFLVILKSSVLKEHELSDIIINRTGIFPTPVNVEIHHVDFVNEGLRSGQQFFISITSNRMRVYDKGTIHLASPKLLSSAQMLASAQNHFDQWMKRGKGFLKGVYGYIDENELSAATFILHQVAESFYATVLLVYNGYKPKTHNLSKLRRQTKNISAKIFLVFDVENEKEDAHLFELLKTSYIGARYKEDFEISKKELLSMLGKLHALETLVEQACWTKIQSLGY